MSGNKRPHGKGGPSINYRLDSTKKGVSIEFGELVDGICAPTVSDDEKTINRSERKSNEILSTAELVSSVGKLWERATHTPFFRPEANLNQNKTACHEDILANLKRGYNGKDYLLVEDKCLSIDRIPASQLSPFLQKSLEVMEITNKMSSLSSDSGGLAQSIFWKLPCSYTKLCNESCKELGLAPIGRSHELGTVYEWMREVYPTGLKYRASFSEAKGKETIENCISGDASSCFGCHVSADRNTPAINLSEGLAEVLSDFNQLNNLSASSDAELVTNVRETTSLCSDNFLGDLQDSKVDDTVLRTEDCSLCVESVSNNLSSSNNTYNDCQPLRDMNEQPENKTKKPGLSIIDDEDRVDVLPRTSEKPQNVLAKQEHAFAGAFAGVFVSLCLHPVDTVKTVIQSCHAEQKSNLSIGRSIVSERGLTGLYRGVASNIVSSAPISAVYTFTYESVKGALLPLFPKESHSLAHCFAGGCASIATSFIFTPSERIKQQMQVGVHYNNCWNALVGIIKNGGLPSLYTGWGAVLCRNIPHSVIKFYTYESLKQMMLASSSAQPNTLQTLACGGLAGSTAALFTTPFDVVKTRLQTQVPGSFTQYNSVPHALQEIGKHEGLKGLYRGLIPRLAMYMSQGAIFFTSYEFFKSLLSLDVPKQSVQHN